jgi:hypothetical protein
VTIKVWQLAALVAVLVGGVGVFLGLRLAAPAATTAAPAPAQATQAETRAQQLQQSAVAPEAALADAQDAVRAAVTALEAYNADHGGYTSATLAGLQQYDPSLVNVTVASSSPSDYCLMSVVGTAVASKHGPTGDIVQGGC